MEGPSDSLDHPRAAPEALGSPSPGADVPPIPQRPCRISFNGFAATEPPRIEVRAWLARLGALTAPMIGGDVVIDALDQGHKHRHYRVRMELVMPAGSVFVGADHPANLPHDDVYVAIRNAFRAVRRELETGPQREAPAAPEVTQ
jgi:hypothetical protein